MCPNKLRGGLAPLIIAAFALCLSACGFTPLYQDQGGNFEAAMSSINLQLVEGPFAASEPFATELRQTLNASLDAKYDLAIELDEMRSTVAVTSSARTTRYNYTLTAKYTLTDRASKASFSSSKFVATSYGLVPSEYASFVGQEDAIRKASIALAKRVELDLMLYFKSGKLSAAEIPLEEFDPERQ